jgi:hypothetical protein
MPHNKICFSDQGCIQSGRLESRICVSDRGGIQLGGLESSCGSGSSVRDKATPIWET